MHQARLHALPIRRECSSPPAPPKHIAVQSQIASHGLTNTETALISSTSPPSPRQTAPAGLQFSRTMPHPTRLKANLAPSSPFTHQNSRQNSPRLTESAIFCQTVRDTSNPIRRPSSRAIHETPSPRFSPRSNPASPADQYASHSKSAIYDLTARLRFADLPGSHSPFQSQNVSRPKPHHTRNRRRSVFPNVPLCSAPL